MNTAVLICRTIMNNSRITQRKLAETLQISLGSVNGQLKALINDDMISLSADGEYLLTAKGLDFMKDYKVNNAIILAAGFGSRFVPLTFDTPKGLLEVFGERMIERQIKQLHEAGITDITIVVGYLKEKFDYLIDKYNVKLVYNPEYAVKNSLSTLYHVRHLLKNTYILASDNWMRTNLYNAYEPAAWYSSTFMKGKTSEWCLITDKKKKITQVQVGGYDSYVMYGPAYFDSEFSEKFKVLLEEYYKTPGTENFYWEQPVKDHIKELNMYCSCQPADTVYEFENLEELRLFDTKYQTSSNNKVMECIAEIFNVPENEITNLKCLKAGMTNKSFLFNVKGTDYIFRIPGPGTDILINRAQEKACYDVVSPLGIADQVLYFDGESGCKISLYYPGSHNCDPENMTETDCCIKYLKAFHDRKLSVAHSFDIAERISYYEALCFKLGGIRFEDYPEVRVRINELIDNLGKMKLPKVMSHIDSIFANFLFLKDGSIKLIDWEYAGMCDPLIDIAMFAIYAYYDEAKLNHIIRTYLDREPSHSELVRIYTYVALSGFLWTLWSEYKAALGEEFGEYILIMYRYAKDYYKKVKALLEVKP